MTANLFAIVLQLFFWAPEAQAANHCARYWDNPQHQEMLISLSQKLQYSIEDFCTLPRIADIYREERLVYDQNSDSYQKFEFVTLHYYEYSCEYHYRVQDKNWTHQYCYNTW